MDIVCDTSVLAADPWLRSKRLLAVRDYALKTRGSLVLLEVVETELRAHVQRSVQLQIDALATAMRNASRGGITDLPPIDAAGLLANTMARWEKALAAFFSGPLAIRVPVDGSILRELVRRAAHRDAPVDSAGRETRDAIVWLSLLAYVKGRKVQWPVAFVSSNTNDFASADGTALRTELASDIAILTVTVEYHSSLDSLLRQHADQVEHISIEWIVPRIDFDEVRDKVAGVLRNADPRPFLRIDEPEYRSDYQPLRIESVGELALDLEDVYVYEVTNGFVHVFLDFHVTGEMEVECTMIRPSPYGGWDYHVDELYASRTVASELRIMASIDAVVSNDRVKLGDVEELAAF